MILVEHFNDYIYFKLDVKSLTFPILRGFSWTPCIKITIIVEVLNRRPAQGTV